ncbi:MAG: MotA/TolQ/ExbB proton channel family protein [Prevotella sp.]|nr:MotA/TolQ/ExbB proton channel family protein [Prevotella sp.]
MRKLIAILAIIGFLLFVRADLASAQAGPDTVETVAEDTAAALSRDTSAATVTNKSLTDDIIDDELEAEESTGFHTRLKTKFIEGNAGFMSLVAIALVLGLAFCIERIVYLTLSEINAKRFMSDLEAKVAADDIEGAKQLCRDTRGPVASICYQGLVRIDEQIDNIERSIVSFGSVQSANLERGCSWITLFISIAPSLGFLGTVIGMVMAFDQIRIMGDISTSIVASGMKVALITTIFGIIAALILQLFYNYVISKIEHLTSQMEESAISLLDMIMKYKLRNDEKSR